MPIGGPALVISSEISAETLRSLPSGGNVFALLETMSPEVIADRFTSGGLSAGESARLSGFLASWRQTQYRIGDASISSPIDGTPLLYPELAWWSGVRLGTALMRPDLTAPGLIVALDPVRPTPDWTGTIETTASGGGLVSAPAAGRAPPITRLDDWTSVQALARGRAGPLDIAAGGLWAAASTFARASTTRRPQHVQSAFANVSKGSWVSMLNSLVWIQSLERPSALAGVARPADAVARDRAVHLQASFERFGADTWTRWRLSGSYTGRSRTEAHDPIPGFTADRLVDGPIPSLVAAGDLVERRWSAGARFSPAQLAGRHRIAVGANVEGLVAAAQPSFRGVINEQIDGVPARVWIYDHPNLESHRSATLVSAFAHDRVRLSASWTLEGSLRFESADGRARGAAQGIAWRSWLPAARLRRGIGAPLHGSLVIGGGRSANQLTLDLLEQGDPAAPVAAIFHFADPPPPGQPLLARAGPGTGGDPAFSAIDPDLKRPITDEFAMALTARPRPSFQLNVAGIARRQTSLINVVNTGAPASAYTTFTIPDPNADLPGSADDQELTVYNRRPETFGQDRYLLTSTGAEAATMGAFVIGARITTDRLFMWIGGTAAAAVGPGGNRGFRAIENDQDVRGEVVEQSQRRHLRARPAVRRSRLHDQVDDGVPLPGRHPARRHRALPGRPAVLADRRRARPQPGPRGDPGVRQRPIPLRVHRDARRAAAERIPGGCGPPRRDPRRLQPAEHDQGGRGVRGHGPALSRDHRHPAAPRFAPRGAPHLLTERCACGPAKAGHYTEQAPSSAGRM